MPAASSIYWDSVDSQRSSGSSADANSGSGRQYVDPWDLENYAYLRRHSVAAPPQYVPPPPAQQRAAHRRRSHERRPEPEVEYWYSPREAIREPGYHAPASVEELYFGPPRHQPNQGSYYQPIYEDDATHYAAPVPIYAPLSDLEHGTNIEDQRLQGMTKHKSKHGRTRGHERYRGECCYHGPSSDVRRDSVDDYARRIQAQDDACYVEVAPPSNMGLNNYGHLKIDYSDSWNSLHRKIAK